MRSAALPHHECVCAWSARSRVVCVCVCVSSLARTRTRLREPCSSVQRYTHTTLHLALLQPLISYSPSLLQPFSLVHTAPSASVLSMCACVAPPSRERPRQRAPMRGSVRVTFLRFSARHTDAARPRGQQVGHTLAPRHLLGVGRVELPKACRVNARGRGDHREAILVGPIRAPLRPLGPRAALGSTGWMYAAHAVRG